MSVLILQAAAAASASAEQYALVFDAGSSGTRCTVFAWSLAKGGDGATYRDLSQLAHKKTEPGVSSFALGPRSADAVDATSTKVEALRASLAPLFDFAKAEVPQEAWPRTPLLFYATAGMRLVSEADRHLIMGWIQGKPWESRSSRGVESGGNCVP